MKGKSQKEGEPQEQGLSRSFSNIERKTKGSLAKGSWHGVAVTEGFTAGTS